MAVASAADAQDTAPPRSVKSLEECVAIGLKNRPSLASAEAHVDAGRARVYQAWSGYLPQLAGSWETDRRESSFNTRTGGPNTAGALSSVNVYYYNSGAVTLSQTLFDFGQNLAAIRAARAREDSLRADADTNRQQVVFDVKQAYFGLLASRRLASVAEETVRNDRQQLDQARGRFDVGFAPKIDVTRSEVLLARAELDLLVARNNVSVAEETLRNALGLDTPIDFDIEDVLDRRAVALSEPEALDTAYTSRPELQSLLAQQRATEQDVAQHQREFLPTLTGAASYGGSGSDNADLDESWLLGARVNVPIFNAGLTANRLSESRANLLALRSDERTLRQSIALDVRRALLEVKRTGESIDVTGYAAEQAAENLDLAQGRYNTGVGSVIELTDAQAQRASAEADRVSALYQHQQAIAALEQAIGRELPKP